MAYIKKIKEGTETIYPATIPQAVVDPTSGKSVRTELDEKAASAELVQLAGDTLSPAAMANVENTEDDILFITGADITNQGYISAIDGSIIASETYYHSEYYAIAPKTAFKVLNFGGSSSMVKIEYSDKNKTPLLADSLITDIVDIYSDAPADARFARFGYLKFVSGVERPIGEVYLTKSVTRFEKFDVIDYSAATVNVVKLFDKGIRGIYVYGDLNVGANYSITEFRNNATNVIIRIFDDSGIEVGRFTEVHSEPQSGVRFLTVPPYNNSGIYVDLLINFDYFVGYEVATLSPLTKYRFKQVCYDKSYFNYDEKIESDNDARDEISIQTGKIISRIQYQNSGQIILGRDFVDQDLINSSTGIVYQSPDYRMSPYYEIVPGQRIGTKNLQGSSVSLRIIYYDKNKGLLLSDSSSEGGTVYSEAPDYARYVRFSYRKYISGVEQPEPVINTNFVFEDSKLLGKYVPIEQINYNHALTLSRTLPWDIVAYRTLIEKTVVIANVVKVPIWIDNSLIGINDYKLLIANSTTEYNPANMRDITQSVDYVEWAVAANSQTIVKLKTPESLMFGEVIVFAWRRNGAFYCSGNINPDSLTDNKLTFLLSGTGVTEWNQALTPATGTTNLTPAMVLLMDEKFVIEENTELNIWQPRKTNVIATTDDFNVIANATKLNQGYTLTGSGTSAANMELYETYIEKFKMVASFEVNTLTGLAFSMGTQIPTYYKAYVRVTDTHFQILYDFPSGTEVKYYEEPILNMAIGIELTLSITKETDLTTFRLFGGGNDITKTVTKVESEIVALVMGTPFVGMINGEVFLKNLSFSSVYDPFYSKIGAWGDSFTAGSSLVATGLENRFLYKLATDIGVLYCPLFARGGRAIDASWFEQFKKEDEWFRPKYVFIQLGTNNLVFSIYQNYLTQAIAYAKERGQIPVLVTVTPTPNNAAFLAQANPFVRTLGERYVDMNKAVTVGDENTWVAAYVMGDNTHPSVAGHQAMYERIKIDVPELFDV